MAVSVKQAKVFKLTEKLALLIGAGLLMGFGLLFVLLADILIKGSSGPLFIDAITLVAGGVLIFWGQSQNAFEVKRKGLIIIAIGLVLSLAGVIYLPIYAASFTEAAGYIKATIAKATTVTYLTFAFALVGLLASIAGYVFQILRLTLGYDND